jgi:peptidoglycan hydrolase-like protein with peptidoglycan-binding domain
MALLHGIDISQHQGAIDWPLVAASAPDLRFVIARMSHGGRGDHNLRVDTQAANNLRGMRAAFAGTPRGFYHFLGMGDPMLQARHFRSVVGELQPGEFVMLDVEPDDAAGVPKLPADQIVRTLDAMREVCGVTPWVYIGLPYLPQAGDPRLHEFPLHFPHFNPGDQARVERDARDKLGRSIMAWQWGGENEGARVEGIPKVLNRQTGQMQTPRIDSNQLLDEALFHTTLVPGGARPRPGGTPLGFMRELAFGDRSNDVFILQTLLIQHGLFQDADHNRDSKFERGTERRVGDFQARHGRPVTGRVDRDTWTLFGSSEVPGGLQFMPEIAEGAGGNPVFLLQGLLVRHGLFQDRDENRDGKFEHVTGNKVAEFQARHGLPATRRVDRTTWSALGTG